MVSAGKLSERDLERALVAQREMGGLLGEVLVRLGLVAEMDVVTALCEQLSLTFVPKEAYPEEPVTVESLQVQLSAAGSSVLLCGPMPLITGRMAAAIITTKSAMIHTCVHTGRER